LNTYCYDFPTAKHQSNCDYTNGTNKEWSIKKKRLEMSAVAIAEIIIGCIALVIVIMAIAVFILASIPMHALRDKCCGRLSMRHGHR